MSQSMQTLDLEIPTTPPLGATLSIPAKPRAAALIHQGSGVHDRDGNMPAVKFKSTLYRRLARELASRAGVISIRFDKRGHDKPAEYPHDYTIPQRLEDARAAVEVLRDHPAAKGLPLHFIGHSEGAMIVTKLAESLQPASVVSLAAPFGNVFELGRERARRLIEQGRGTTRAKGELALEYYDLLEERFKRAEHLSPEQFVELARPYRDAGYYGWESPDWLAGHWAEALKPNPPCPILVVQGGRDARLWEDNPQRWQQWCESRQDATFKLIEQMGHDLNDARQKLFRVDEEVLETVTGWIAGIGRSAE